MALTLCLRSVSQRVYTGPRSQPGRGGNRWFRLIPWAFVALTIGLQIAWVLVPDSARVPVTAASVTAFFLASVTHAFVNRGLAWTLGFFVITLAFGWLIEVLGTTTQFPFGEYEYTSTLGVSVLSVPILIPWRGRWWRIHASGRSAPVDDERGRHHRRLAADVVGCSGPADGGRGLLDVDAVGWQLRESPAFHCRTSSGGGWPACC